MSADIDLGALSSWLDAQGIAGGTPTEVSTLDGGTQNDVLAFTRGARRLIVRRQPVREGGTDSARREARVLAALATTDVPHPRLVAACTTVEPLGAPFQVSERVDGFSLWADDAGRCPEATEILADPARVRWVGEQIVSGFGALARQSPAALGLGDLGRGTGWTARQPRRWRDLYERYREQGGPAVALEGVDEIDEWLGTRVPDDAAPGVVHGDAHLGNVLVHCDGSGSSIIDWELATVGDPRLDLAELLVTWPSTGAPYAWRVRVEGLPDEAAVVDLWERTSGRSADQLLWFRVLAGYRLAVLLEGTHVRALAGQADAEVGAALHERATQLIAATRDTTAATRTRST